MTDSQRPADITCVCVCVSDHLQLVTLRGFILEDAVASTGRHGTVRGLPLKEVLEQVVSELSISCLRLALSTPKVTEQLLKLDEQGVSSPSASCLSYFRLRNLQKDGADMPECVV